MAIVLHFIINSSNFMEKYVFIDLFKTTTMYQVFCLFSYND